MTLCSSCACKQSDGWCGGWHQFTSRDVHCPYYKRKGEYNSKWYVND